MAQETMTRVPLDRIRNNPDGIRNVDRKNIEYLELVESVRKHGVKQPIQLRECPPPDGETEPVFGLINGLQRYSASVECGYKDIPAVITTASDAEVEEQQIILNAVQVTTTYKQYADAIQRILQRNPTITKSELAAKFSKRPEWIDRVLGFKSKLTPEIFDLLSEGKIPAVNAQELAKLPKEEQPSWVEQATTAEHNLFKSQVLARKQEIQKARAQGQKEKPAEFKPTPHQRKWQPVLEEFESTEVGAAQIKRFEIKTPLDAWKAALAWCCMMDPDSQAEAIAKEEARKAAAKEERDKKDLEKQQRREEEARKTKEEIMARLRSGQPVEAGAD